MADHRKTLDTDLLCPETFERIIASGLYQNSNHKSETIVLRRKISTRFKNQRGRGLRDGIQNKVYDQSIEHAIADVQDRQEISKVKPKFSILTACFNNVLFLKDYISVLEQNYDNFEVVFVDDCSTDGSWEYIQGVNDPRIRAFRNETQIGCSSSYARALVEASGDLCGVVDADDVLATGAISVISQVYQQRPEIGYIYTQHHWCDKNLHTKKVGVSGLPKNSNLAEMALRGRHCFSHWRTFRKDVANKGIIFPEGLKYSVDKYMGFALEELAVGAFFPTALYFYRYHAKNMSSNFGLRQREMTNRMARDFLKHRELKKIRPIKIIPI